MKIRHGKVIALVGLWAGVTFGMAAMPGCYGQNCESTIGSYGSKPGEGNMIDEDTWESTPIDGKWLHFPSRQIWFFEVPAFGDRKPYEVIPMISPVEEPYVYGEGKPSSNATVGGGNLAEISGIDRNRVNVSNGTCAEYFLRVVVHLPPKPPQPDAPVVVDASVDASDPDAGDGGDAGNPSDAGDAGTDAEAGP